MAGSAVKISDDDLAALKAIMDVDGSGMVDYEEFIAFAQGDTSKGSQKLSPTANPMVEVVRKICAPLQKRN